jgi:hypothetical protein
VVIQARDIEDLVRAAVRAILIATRILRAQLPNLHLKRLAEIVSEVVEGGCAEGEEQFASRLMDENRGGSTCGIAETRPPA